MEPKDASRSRRRHSAQLKSEVLAACDAPGASVAAVARAHDLNANLVHRWRQCRDGSATARAGALTDGGTAFVPVQLEMPRAVAADIRLELRRGAATAVVTWPAHEAAACGRWLCEWLG